MNDTFKAFINLLERNPSPGTAECLDLDFFPMFMNFQPFQEHQRIQGTPAALQLPFVFIY